MAGGGVDQKYMLSSSLAVTSFMLIIFNLQTTGNHNVYIADVLHGYQSLLPAWFQAIGAATFIKKHVKHWKSGLDIIGMVLIATLIYFHGFFSREKY